MSPFSGLAPAPCNRFLDALSLKTAEQLRQSLQSIDLEHGDVVCEYDEPIRHVIFPETAVVAFVSPMADGTTPEIGVAGRDGVVGLAAVFGIAVASTQAVVQVPGTARRIRADALRDVFGINEELRDVARAFALALLIQTSHTAVCNGHHSIERRLARWLLTVADRAPSDDLPFTHETMAARLGTHRPGISAAASGLQKRNLIAYVRGHVRVVDRGGLERAACDCYRDSRDECERALAGRGDFRLPVAV